MIFIGKIRLLVMKQICLPQKDVTFYHKKM